MSDKIYISRKCEHCHELLILLHKNKDILKFPVVDIHTNPYPKIVTSVPCMVVDGKVLPGQELFKFINYLIQQNSKEIVKENDLMPNVNPKENPRENQNSLSNAGPMHNGNPLNLNQSSNQRNLNVPGNVQDNVQDTINGMVKQDNNMLPDNSDMKPQNINDVPSVGEDELLPGFCVGGVCELGFSSLEDEKDISMDNTFEMLNSSGDITPQMDEGNTKSEKGKQVDDDYSRMMQERGNDMGMKMN